MCAGDGAGSLLSLAKLRPALALPSVGGIGASLERVSCSLPGLSPCCQVGEKKGQWDAEGFGPQLRDDSYMQCLGRELYHPWPPAQNRLALLVIVPSPLQELGIYYRDDYVKCRRNVQHANAVR